MFLNDRLFYKNSEIILHEGDCHGDADDDADNDADNEISDNEISDNGSQKAGEESDGKKADEKVDGKVDEELISGDFRSPPECQKSTFHQLEFGPSGFQFKRKKKGTGRRPRPRWPKINFSCSKSAAQAPPGHHNITT